MRQVQREIDTRRSCREIIAKEDVCDQLHCRRPSSGCFCDEGQQFRPKDNISLPHHQLPTPQPTQDTSAPTQGTSAAPPSSQHNRAQNTNSPRQKCPSCRRWGCASHFCGEPWLLMRFGGRGYCREGWWTTRRGQELTSGGEATLNFLQNKYLRKFCNLLLPDTHFIGY